MRKSIGLTVFIVAIGPWWIGSAAEPGDLLKYIPKPVNAIAIINVKAILSTSRATKEKWAQRDHEDYLAGSIPVHSSIERILFAKDLSLEDPAGGVVYAVVPQTVALDIEKLATAHDAHPERVDGEPLYVAPGGIVGVKLSDTLLGVARIDSRQEMARWVRHCRKATTSQQDKYLAGVAYGAGTGHHILIAVDTDELFHPKLAAQSVAESRVLSTDANAADAVREFILGLKGVRFAADIKFDGIAAELRFDSASTTKVSPDAVKAFLIESLDRSGAALEDLRAAVAKADGKAVILTFRMSDPELARVMGLITVPAADLAASFAVRVAPAGATPDATRRYYRAVNQALDGVKVQNKKAKDYVKTAVWHDTAAYRIETLSVLNVDPAVAEYGAGTAARLRAIADSLRGVPVQAAVLESKTYVFGYYARRSLLSPAGPLTSPYAYSGPTSLQTNLPKIREQQSEVVKSDSANRSKLWEQMDRQRSEVRRTLQEKAGYDLEAAATKK